MTLSNEAVFEFRLTARLRKELLYVSHNEMGLSQLCDAGLVRYFLAGEWI